MGGYQQILSVPYRPRGMLIVPQGQNWKVILGDSHRLSTFPMGETGNALSGLVNRTPEGGFISDLHTTWQFQTLYTAGTQTQWLIAHGAPNLTSIASPIETPEQ